MVNRANRNSVKVFGRVLSQKHGKKWALTDFGFEIWGKTKKDFEADSEAAEKPS